MAFRNPWKSLKVRVSVVTSVVWLVGLWVLTLTINSWLRQDLQQLLGENQLSSATVASDQITHEIRERIEALESVATQLSQEPLGDVDRIQSILDGRPILTVLFNAGAFMTDADGIATASVPLSAGRRGRDYAQRNHVRAALKEGRSSVSDVVIGAALQVPVFSIGVPLHDKTGRVVGCLVGVTDLTHESFLNNLTNNKLGQTGGYLLVSRAQRLIVTATDHRRIMEKLASPGVNPQIDRFLDGGEGVQVLVNPLKVEVLVAARQVPVAGWYVAVAAPTSEVFAPVRDLQERMLWFAAFLTALTASLNWLLLKRQLSPVVTAIRTLSELTDSKQPLKALPVARSDEIGALIESFNRLLLDLEKRETERNRYEALLSQSQRLEALGLLAGGIAHDFNNLLAGIYGNIELALLKDAQGPASPYLAKSLKTLGRARGLTQQLLTFSKGGAPDLKNGDLFPFVEDTVQFALSGTPVTCRFDVEPGLRPCRFDRNQLAQVFDNLVINARQVMPQDGTLTVTARNLVVDGQESVCVSVTDTGPGMTKEAQEHLFEPFFTTKSTGHGLGLTTCYSIVRRHGGSIEVETALGRGTTVRVTLPAAIGTEVVPPPRSEAPLDGRGTLLVLDDETEVGLVLEEMLHSFGYRVIRTETGEAALAAFRDDWEGNRVLRAAILDLTVPGGLGGLEVGRQLKETDPGFPLVVASGFSEIAVVTDPVAAGFSAVLRKPYLRSDLEAVLGRVLENRTPER